LVLTFSLTSLSVFASEGVNFVVRPKLCVLTDGEEQCRDTLELSWTSAEATSVCLFQTDKTLPLRCWENESEGKHLVSISTAENIEFQLREVDNRSLLVVEQFEVLHDQPQLRRRKRNPWSIF
jgi:hypothetical protein